MSSGGGPWWEFDPDERPVPLEGAAEAVAEVAEEIVEAHRQSIIREDTEPTAQTLAALGEQMSTVDFESDRSRSLVPASCALLLVGCVAMFSLGWSQGAAARQGSGRAPTQEVTRITSDGDSAKSNEGSGPRMRARESKEVSDR